MAKRRCIGVDVYESPEFLSLSDKAKVLYTYFMLRCDDEGVVINPRLAMWITRSRDEELAELTGNGLVLEVEGLYVIRHWYVHNRIQPSKKTDSVYQKELSALSVNEKRIYEFSDSDGGKNPPPSS